MTVTPSSTSSATSDGSTSSIWLLTWRRSSAPEGISKTPKPRSGFIDFIKYSAVPRGLSGALSAASARASAAAPAMRCTTPPAHHGGAPGAALVATARLACALCASRRPPARPRRPPPRPPAPAASPARRCPPGVRAPAFTLRDQSGRRVSLADYRGRVTIVAFVYSTCGGPASCIAQQIRGALDELDRPVPVLLISADPGADTPAASGAFSPPTSHWRPRRLSARLAGAAAPRLARFSRDSGERPPRRVRAFGVGIPDRPRRA